MAKCNSCGEIIDEPANLPADQRTPCPSCGSKTRFFEIEPTGEVTLHKELKLKARHGQPGQLKPFLQLQVGDDLHKDTGEWNYREKIEDRKNNHYSEHIVNPKTGEVLHHCEERLHQHQGHGSAKKKELVENDDV